MEDKSALIHRIFQAIEDDERGEHFWQLLEQTRSDEGPVYMTYASQTPQSLAQQLHRTQLFQLLQLHENLARIRARFLS